MDDKLHPQFYFFKGLSSADPQKLMKMETIHIMMIFFFVDGLHILGKQSLLQKDDLKKKLITYILNLQLKNGSFTCSSLYQNLSKDSTSQNIYQHGHIVFTYSALNSLFILGALQQIQTKKVLDSLRSCKKQDGSFSCFPNSRECDLRFVYSALSICKLLNDFSIIDKEKTLEYINSCFNYDGGFGLRPNIQSHSGAIFCAVASYEHLDQKVPEKMKRKILNFLVNRQSTQIDNQNIVGVQGRVGKLPDSCYSFWVGASIMILTQGRNLLNENIQNFIMMCFKEQEQSFAKYPSNKMGDPVHTFHSIMGLKILNKQLENISVSQLLRP